MVGIWLCPNRSQQPYALVPNHLALAQDTAHTASPPACKQCSKLGAHLQEVRRDAMALDEYNRQIQRERDEACHQLCAEKSRLAAAVAELASSKEKRRSLEK